MFDRKSGDEVKSGDTIARIQLGESSPDPEELRSRFLKFITIGDAPPAGRPLVFEHLK